MTSRLPCRLAALTLLAALSGCGRDVVKADFMEGCVQSGVSKSICKCIFGKMEPDLRAMQAAGRTSPGAEVRQRLMQATAACARE